jgi:peptidyl-prolyl cis-trans isomerase C
MKRLSLLFFLCLSAGAQSQPAKPPAPVPSKPAATIPSDLPPDTVLATFGDGHKLTFGELKKFMRVLPPQMQQLAMRDRKAFVQQYALMNRLAEMAAESKLDQQSPTKEQLEFNRIYVLMNAELNDAMSRIAIPPAEEQHFYDTHKKQFAQAKVKVLYVSFHSNASPHSMDGKKILSEPEAKAKIEKLRDEIAHGADFVKLIKTNSEDADSAAKNGNFGTIRRTDKIPQPIKDAVFALKPGQVSPPVRQPNGFYLFRVEDISTQAYADVKSEIENQLRQAKFKEWMDKTNQSLNIHFENQSFFQ